MQQKEENIFDRIKKIASNEEIKITALERKIGASKGVLSKAIAKGTNIQQKWLQKIVEIYPLYSPEWLVTGKGEMLKKESQVSVGDVTNSIVGTNVTESNIIQNNKSTASNLKNEDLTICLAEIIKLQQKQFGEITKKHQEQMGDLIKKIK